MPKTRFRHLAALLAALAVLPMVSPLACAVPEGVEISPFDAERMSGFDRSRSQGLAEALLSESAQDRALVSGLFVPAVEPIAALPDGNYRCRTTKLGGLLPLVAYGFFDCAVSGDGSLIEKPTGSQRFAGSLTPSEGALFYAGALYYNNESPIDYGADAERDQVGCLYEIAGETPRYRLEMPSPRFESTHDVLELVPSR